MRIREYVDSIHCKNFHEISQKPLDEILAYFHQTPNTRLYIVEENRPVYIFTPKEIIDIFLENKNFLTIGEYVLENKKEIFTLDASTNIIDAYNQLRKRKLSFAPVMEGGKLIGEVSFETLSLKISFIAIKDPLTGAFNQRYFDVLVEEYKEMDKPLGIIFVKIENLSIFESLYGHSFKLEVLRKFADTIHSSLRDIDFVFRVEDIFKIITFNDLEIVSMIVARIKKRLSEIKINDIKIPFKIVFSQVPEIESNIILAIEDCEKKLIKRD